MLQVNKFTYRDLYSYLSRGKNPNYRKIGNNTVIHRIDTDCIAVRYHETDIARIFANDQIELYARGYLTYTTKERLNEIIPRPYRIYQNKGMWHVWNYAIQAEIGLFQDGLTILPDGSISGFADNRELDKQTKLRRKVNKYIDKFITALFAGKVDKPSAGDCLYCQFRNENNKSMGELFHDTDHIMSHLAENYFVPSMLYNAINNYPVSQVSMWVITSLWWPDRINFKSSDYIENWGGIARDQIRKSLRKYIYSQLNLPH